MARHIGFFCVFDELSECPTVWHSVPEQLVDQFLLDLLNGLPSWVKGLVTLQ
jgi:hypothetical protein